MKTRKPSKPQRAFPPEQRHWRAFLEAVPWFLKSRDKPKVLALHEAGFWRAEQDVAKWFPKLAKLLKKADVTEVFLRGQEHVLFTWASPDGPRSWLCCAPMVNPPAGIFPQHAALLRVFGGIIQQVWDSQTEETWVDNCNEVLTAKAALTDATFYEDAFEEVSKKIPIVLHDYAVIAQEANGNVTLCHRRNGKVLMFAHDHSFDYVTPLAGCINSDLMKIKHVTLHACLNPAPQ